MNRESSIRSDGPDESGVIDARRRASAFGIRAVALSCCRVLAPAVVAVFLPSVACRFAVLPRATTFNPSLRGEVWWSALPRMVAWDALAAVLVAVLLSPLMLLGGRSRRRAALGRMLQIIACSLAVLVMAVQYRTFAEVGFFPSAATLRRFLAADSPFLNSLGSYMDARSISQLLLALLAPALFWGLAARYQPLGAALFVFCLATLPFCMFWPVAPAASPLVAHPFSHLPPAAFEWPTPRDPEVSEDPPSMNSLHARAGVQACDAALRPMPDANIVLVVLESVSLQYVFRDGVWRFPGLRRMAGHARFFDRYYSPAGQSNPALYAILTGRHVIPSDSWWDTPADRAHDALPSVLAASGYECGFFMSGCFRYFFDERLFRGMGWRTCEDGDDLARRLRIPAESRDPDGHCIDDATLIDEARAWVAARCRGRSPWMAVIYPGVPHMPYGFQSGGPHAIHRHRPLSAFEAYENQLAYVDAQLGRLYDFLTDADFFARGYLVVTADHGEAFNQHPNNVVHGTHVYDENLRVPLLIVGPKSTKAATCPTPGSHVDLAPTILQLLDRPPPPVMAGRSLLGDGPQRMIFLSAAHHQMKTAVLDWPYKYIFAGPDEPAELYHLDDDPAERTNLAGRQPARSRSYRSWIKSFMYHWLTPRERRDLPPAQRELDEGRRILATGGAPSAAAVHFRQALQLKPENPSAKTGLAACLLGAGIELARLGSWSAALMQFEESLRLDPQSAAAQAARAEALTHEGRVDDAITLLRASTRQDPSAVDLRLRLAWLLCAESTVTGRDPAEAARLLPSPAGGGTPDIDELEVRAIVAAAGGQFQDAIAWSQKALDLDRSRERWDRPSRAPGIEKRLQLYREHRLAPAWPYPAGLPAFIRAAEQDHQRRN